MNFNLVSLFPEVLESVLSVGVVGQARRAGLLTIKTVNPRLFATDRHGTVDDRPYGGSPGMVLKADTLAAAIESLGPAAGRIVNLSPQGLVWSDQLARQWAQEMTAGKWPQITFICGRYEGVDERFISRYVDEEVSIGDFVLSGGEIAALAVIDSLSRFLPGVLGNEASSEEDSFSRGLLDGPVFTRPREFAGLPVPGFLLTGDHALLAKGGEALALVTTFLRRRDLWEKLPADQQGKMGEAVDWLEKWPDDELAAVRLNRSDLVRLRSSPHGGSRL